MSNEMSSMGRAALLKSCLSPNKSHQEGAA